MDETYSGPTPKRRKRNRVLLLVIALLLIGGAAFAGATADRLFDIKPLDTFLKNASRAGVPLPSTNQENQRVVNEENVVVDVAEKVSPSVVTVSIQTPQ